jgi:hypothetical protein
MKVDFFLISQSNKIPNYAEQCWIAVKVSATEATCAMYVGTLAKERRLRHEKKKREKATLGKLKGNSQFFYI